MNPISMLSPCDTPPLRPIHIEAPFVQMRRE
jgi:hypothetical protein